MARNVHVTRVTYSVEYGTLSIEYGTWSIFGQPNIEHSPYSVGFSFSMLTKTYFSFN